MKLPNRRGVERGRFVEKYKIPTFETRDKLGIFLRKLHGWRYERTLYRKGGGPLGKNHCRNRCKRAGMRVG